MTDSLLDLVVRVHAESGRPLDDARLERMRNRISRLGQAHAAIERNLMKKMLNRHGGTTTPNRNRP